MSLEKNSIWYKYKSKAWKEESPQANALHSIVRTLRSIHNQGELAYASIPLTSGITLYQEILKTTMSPATRAFLTGLDSTAHKYKLVPRFKGIKQNLFANNYNRGKEFVQDLENRIDKPILFPGDLYPKGEKWAEYHFQALWTTLISEKCSELHMIKDWEYSNGATEEFTHAHQLKLGIPQGDVGEGSSPFYNSVEGLEKSRQRMKNIKVYDHEGNILSINEGITKMEKSIDWIKKRSFYAPKLEKTLEILKWTDDMIKKGFYQ